MQLEEVMVSQTDKKEKKKRRYFGYKSLTWGRGATIARKLIGDQLDGLLFYFIDK